MANPPTTHVIEIETGIGEPAFIPLAMGRELQPISVGKKGMWRLESARVLDVHAFVYFDGASLFFQSADEQSAAVVGGQPVGKSWTELHAPCTIEIGAARLRYRSLSTDADKAPAAGPSPRAASNPPRTEVIRSGRPQTPAADPAGQGAPLVEGAPAPMPPIPGPPGMPRDGLGQSLAPQGAGSSVAQRLAKRPLVVLGLVAGVFALLATIVFVARVDKGTGDAKPVTAVPQSLSPPWPSNVPCPPPNWPPEVPLPCTPNALGSAAAGVGGPAKDPSPETWNTTSTTLERQAVDLVVAGNTARAAAAYEELARRDPHNMIYPEAARILRGNRAP